MNTLALKNAKRLLQGNKLAVIAPVTDKDQFRVGDQWHSFDDWTLHNTVEEIQHFGRHTTKIGETVMIRDVPSGELVCTVEILEIQMSTLSSLTAEDIQDLGYADRAAFEEANPLKDRKVWLMRIFPAPSDGNKLH